MFGNSLQRFPGEVQPIKIGITMFEMGENANSLGVMVKPAIILHCGMQPIFPSMAKRRVAEIMGEGKRFCQILIQPQIPCNGARQLPHFQRMGKARAVMVTLMVDEYLRFIFQPPERGGVNNPVAVALIRRAHVAFRFGVQPPARSFGGDGVGGQGGISGR